MGQHRAEHARRQHPAASATPRTAPASPGHRAAPSRVRRALRLPSLPTLIGVVVIAGAATGAVTIGDRSVAGQGIALSSQSHRASLTGTDAVGYSGNPRAMAISRDSERQALQDAADQKLQAAAEEQAAERNAELKSLGRAGEIAKNQWHLPTQGYHLTARFGMAGGLWSSNHTGLDFAAPTGTPIFAVANGVITETGWAGSYGNRTVETLTDGTEIWYAHQSAIGVKPGQQVIGGQTIGAVGATGNVTGPHVHLEVRPGGGDPVDPFTALVYHGVRP